MLLESHYPKIVRARKWAIGAFALFLLSCGLVVAYNLTHAVEAPNNKATMDNQSLVTANPSEMDAIEQKQLHKASQTKTPPTTVNPVAAAKPAEIPSVATTNSPTHEVTKAEEDLQKAIQAPISSNQLTGHVENDVTPSASRQVIHPAAATMTNQNNEDDPNKQQEKQAFLQAAKNLDEDYLHASLKKPLSPYELKAGNIIPGVLLTGINADLPGQITAQVRSHVYDSIAGKHLLIPQGAKLTGSYDSQIVYGQQRILVVWQRILFPNGNSIDLQGMPGMDVSGYSGFKDQVNNHYFKLFGSVALMSLMGAGAQLSQPQQFDKNGQISINQTIAQSLGVNLANTANHITQKNLNIQPTLEIRPGYLFNIAVTKDIVFPGAYSSEVTLQTGGEL